MSCSCEIKWHIVSPTAYFGETIKLCKECNDKRLSREAQEAKHRKYIVNHLTPLHCGCCDKIIGMCYEDDFNGSYFYCLDCAKENN